jgi:hypothetical protein
MRRELIPAAILAIATQAVGPAGSALAAQPAPTTFSFTGAEQSWVVPAGVTQVHVTLVGGRGGANAQATANGGRGASVEGDLDVTPSQTLYLEVGGNGQNGGGSGYVVPAFNGGGLSGSTSPGAGGGGTDIRTAARSDAGTLDSRLVIAAGGGGAGGGASSPPTPGGDASQPGVNAPAPGDPTLSAQGGGAGTALAGGAGGAASSSGGSAGTAGSYGVGGNGGVPGAFGGGGGGGGYFGGGGGGAGEAPLDYGAGGGGGASFTGSLKHVTVGFDASGVPSITIAITVVDTGAVEATVTMAESVACVELSTGSIDFGTRQFGDAGIAANPGITVTNCGDVSESIFAHGTDAAGDGPTTWTLNDTGTCAGGTLPADGYGLTVERQDTNAQLRLATSNKALETLVGRASLGHLARIDTPCPGSLGAGVVMTMHIVFLATE